ncbi:hypothetical protein WN51_03487 [Melipona quadrifasciata]|uniref:Uncharacterized protein n=1 Tax=Melipona quadrifasciata TaxID=166423 RepID=A0A0M8ZWW1_9HYME|nr:hypothetical protein WN51_03487 [Melipona quadrifasciata]
MANLVEPLFSLAWNATQQQIVDKVEGDPGKTRRAETDRDSLHAEEDERGISDILAESLLDDCLSMKKITRFREGDSRFWKRVAEHT